MNPKRNDRRTFIKESLATGVGLVAGWQAASLGGVARADDFTARVSLTKGDDRADNAFRALQMFKNRPINVLVEADSDWSKKTEPLAFTVEYGKGRVFHEAFGHDVKAVNNPTVQKLIQRGCEWAATGKVQ